MTPSATIPIWARPATVVTVCVLWSLWFGALSAVGSSALGVDAALEIYNAQDWALTYSPRNPPLYDWVLVALQPLIGHGGFAQALLNYGGMLACALLLYQLARRLIADERLAALSVFSLPMLWTWGYESHRILTHSNLMIVAIAASLLLIERLARRPTLAGYCLLGLVLAVGVLAKYAFIGFIGAFGLAMLTTPGLRRAALDGRIALTLAIAALFPVAHAVAATWTGFGVVDSAMGVMVSAPARDRLGAVGAWLQSFAGYLSPFAVVAAVVFRDRLRARDEAQADAPAFERFLRHALLLSAIGTLVWVVSTGVTTMRPRYFHALLLPAPLWFFLWIERRRPTPAQATRYAWTALAVGLIIVVVTGVARLAPVDAVCGTCRLSTPWDRLGADITGRYGTDLTVVGHNDYIAGQLRAAIDGVRSVTVVPSHYRPPPRRVAHCLVVWRAFPGSEGESDAMRAAVQANGLDPDRATAVDVAVRGILHPSPPTRRFMVLEVPSDSALCK